MAIARLIYSGGVEAESTVGGLRLVTADVIYPTTVLLQTSMPERKIILCQQEENPGLWLLHNSRTGNWLHVEQSSLLSDPINFKNFHQIRNLTYHLSAVTYHCSRLAVVYAEICKRMARFPKFSEDQSKPGYYSTNNLGDDGYFEFDACVTAVRRIYDVLRFPLWTHFNSKPANCRNSLERVLKDADEMPEDLRQLVRASWDNYGEKAKAYRDSIQHFEPVEFGHGTAATVRLKNLALSAMIYIPDNPEAQSRRKFTFKQRLDALDYCHDLACELSALITEVVSRIGQRTRERSVPGTEQT